MAFGAYIARCVDLRYALPYGRVNLISTIPTLDTSNMSKRTPGFSPAPHPVLHSHIHGPSEIRAPTPRDARAFPVLPMCHAVFDVDRILHARAAPPHARLFVFIVCASSP